MVATMPDDFVEMVEKSCEKERRKQLREEKIEEQRVEREARLKTAMERAKVTSPACASALLLSIYRSGRGSGVHCAIKLGLRV